MGRPSSLHAGLWLRMLVAGVVAVVGQALVLGCEFGLLVLLSLMFIFTLEAFFTVAVALAAVAVGAFCCRSALTAFRRRSGRSEEEEEGGRRSRTRAIADGRTLGLALVATVALLVAVETVVWGSVFDPLGAGFAIGLLGVGTHLAWVGYVEWTGDAAALRPLEAAVRVPDSPSDDLEADRRAVRARVDRLAAQAGVPAPAVRLGEAPIPTAATVGYRPATSTVVVSRGLVETLADRELDAVLAHELAHLQHRDATVVTALSTPAAYARTVIGRHSGHPAVLLPGGLVVVAVRWSVAVVSRYREYLADDGAVAITGDPAALASALEKLDRDLERRPATDLRESRTATVFSVVAPPWEERRNFDRVKRFLFRGVFGTHPPTAKRIERLRSAASTE